MPSEILEANKPLLTDQESNPEEATLGIDGMTDQQLRDKFNLQPLPEQPKESIIALEVPAEKPEEEPVAAGDANEIIASPEVPTKGQE